MPAIDNDTCTADKYCIIAREEQRDFGDIDRLAELEMQKSRKALSFLKTSRLVGVMIAPGCM